MSQGFLARFTVTPRLMRWLFNLWPPFRGAGVWVKHIEADWSAVEVHLQSKLLNRNYVGTHFGGSLFAMTDPFCMILMMQQLGKGYVVWDRAASIEFLKPGKGRLTAHIGITAAMVAEAREKTQTGDKFEPTYPIEVKNVNNEIVARITKTLYIRKAKKS